MPNYKEWNDRSDQTVIHSSSDYFNINARICANIPAVFNIVNEGIFNLIKLCIYIWPSKANCYVLYNLFIKSFKKSENADVEPWYYYLK